jgi:hypothetical protein
MPQFAGSGRLDFVQILSILAFVGRFTGGLHVDGIKFPAKSILGKNHDEGQEGVKIIGLAASKTRIPGRPKQGQSIWRIAMQFICIHSATPRSYAGLPIIVVFERAEKGCNAHATQRFFLPAVQGDL